MARSSRTVNKNDSSETSVHASSFQAIFEAVPGLYLILKPDFTIVAVSDAYLEATHTRRKSILGKHLFEVFPDNPNDPNATGVKNLTISLNTVLSTKASHAMAVQKYDVKKPASQGGNFEERYWSPLNSPVLDKNGKVEYIIHSVVDVTQFIKLKQIEEKHSKVAEQLKEQNKLFQAEVVQSAKDIEEHKKNEAELLKLDKVKSEFIAIASHQLRTPLTSVKWSSEELLRNNKQLTENKQDQYLRQIHDSNERMIELVRELLDVSKVDLGNFSIKPEAVHITAVLEQVLVDVSAQIRAKQIVLNKKIQADLPVIMIDPNWARIILQNLLTNAIKYSKDKKAVTIEISRKSDTIQISVEDHGCGIPADEQDKVFTKFFRAHNAKRLVSDGSGLGLYIVKVMVEQIGGQVDFKSVEDKGATFYVTLPVRRG
jgi:signal transduction histidine kinase